VPFLEKLKIEERKTRKLKVKAFEMKDLGTKELETNRLKAGELKPCSHSEGAWSDASEEWPLMKTDPYRSRSALRAIIGEKTWDLTVKWRNRVG
jgi:hypothetical protein